MVFAYPHHPILRLDSSDSDVVNTDGDGADGGNFGVLLFLLFDLNRKGRKSGIGIADGGQSVGTCSHEIKAFSIKTAVVWPTSEPTGGESLLDALWLSIHHLTPLLAYQILTGERCGR